jgi:hypothetical protein
MLRFFLTGVALAALAAPAFADTKSYNFNNFTKLDISAGYQVIFTQSSQRSVTIESEDFSVIEVEQRGDTLRISRPKNTNINHRRSPDIVRISAPDLNEASLNAGVKFSVDGLNVDTLVLDINAGVEATFKRVQAQTIKLDANAGVEVDLAGSCQSLEIEASAGVDVDAEDLRCNRATVDAGVGSSVSVHAVDSVSADAGLGASIRVAGAPKTVDKQTSLGGSVTLLR